MLQVNIQKYQHQNIIKVPKVKNIMQNGPFQNNKYDIIDALKV